MFLLQPCLPRVGAFEIILWVKLSSSNIIPSWRPPLHTGTQASHAEPELAVCLVAAITGDLAVCAHIITTPHPQTAGARTNIYRILLAMQVTRTFPYRCGHRYHGATVFGS
jgi:hypothetical protein